MVAYQLDDGHLYERLVMDLTEKGRQEISMSASYGHPLSRFEAGMMRPTSSYFAPPATKVQVCEAKSERDGQMHYSLTMNGPDGSADEAPVARE